ncbi:serine hydrolase [Microbulbifer bruguierae]|uniref:Serine hydrolase n=1 Tax=Microbulbifer bruguierae TaxID=3029061 RepID=A0ABY8NJW7_9GAMM|nr:serine hydrolase domain-containing protein [Microbulbifer bruguierae]WGL17898.1 serine hydrolase [Microbulbifer bruguierae]
MSLQVFNLVIGNVMSSLGVWLRNRRVDLIVLLVVLTGLATGTHFWIADRNGVMKALFPVQAFLAPVSCSNRTPQWLSSLAKDLIPKMRAISSQLILIRANGDEHHCETGWIGTPLISDSLNETARFRYASMTKPITAAAILELERQGRLSMNTPVLDVFFPELVSGEEGKPEAAEIQIQHLLEHRAGLVGKNNQIFNSRRKPWCPYALDKLTSAHLKFAPGSDTQYTNINHCLLGEVIAHYQQTPVREALSDLLSLENLGIRFIEEVSAKDEVKRDFRNNEFYGERFTGNFDYLAVSATAGLSGSALAYGHLMTDLIERKYPGFITRPEDMQNCDTSVFRQCYGKAFYLYKAHNQRYLNVKEGYLPGMSGVVVVTQVGDIFVWLANADMPNSVKGEQMKWLLEYLSDYIG